MKREMINCKIPIKFPLEANDNGIRFSKESFKNISKGLKNAPIIKDSVAIGVLTDKFYITQTEKEIVINVDGWLWVECLPEIDILKVEKIDGVNVITDFNFLSVNIKTK
jgi:hypothetical protein